MELSGHLLHAHLRNMGRQMAALQGLAVRHNAFKQIFCPLVAPLVESAAITPTAGTACDFGRARYQNPMLVVRMGVLA